MPINGSTPMQYPFPYKTDDGLLQTSGSGGGGGSGVSSFSGDGQVLSNIASTGDVAATLATHPKNLVLASSATTDGQQPTFRALVAADLPGGSSTTLPNITLTDPDNQVRFSDTGGVAELRQTGTTNPSFQLTGSDGLTNKSILNTNQVKLTGTSTQFRATESTNSELDQVNVLNTNNGTSGGSFLRANSNGKGLQVGIVNPGNKTSPNGTVTTKGAGVVRTVSDVDGLDIICEGVSKKIRLGFDDGTTYSTQIEANQSTGITLTAPSDLGIVLTGGTNSNVVSTKPTHLNNYVDGYYINEIVSNLYFDNNATVTTTLTYPQLNKTGTINISEPTDPASDTRNSVYNVLLPDPTSTGISAGLKYTIYNGSVSASLNNVLFIYDSTGLTLLAGPILANMGTESTLMKLSTSSSGYTWQSIPTYNNFAPRQFTGIIEPARESDPFTPQLVSIDPFLSYTFQEYTIFLDWTVLGAIYSTPYIVISGHNVVDSTKVNINLGEHTGDVQVFLNWNGFTTPPTQPTFSLNTGGNCCLEYNKSLNTWLVTYKTPFTTLDQRAWNITYQLISGAFNLMDLASTAGNILKNLGKGTTMSQAVGSEIRTTSISTSGSTNSLNSLSNTDDIVSDVEQSVQYAADSSVPIGTEIVNNWVVSGAYISPWKSNPLYIGP